MKKKIIKYCSFLLLLITIGIVSYKVMGVDDTPANEAFDDYNFYKCVIDAYNKNNEHVDYNHNLTDAELEKITRLSCNGANKSDEEKITSAKGIEKLTQLIDLDLGCNKLSEIDVTKNTQLTSLNLSNNNLNEIDVKANTQLIDLRLDNNKLSEIDVSANTQLNVLRLYNNKLNEIDVTKNTQLRTLDLDFNKISAIDVSQNTELTSLWLDNNKLNEIDLSQNTHLITLWMSNNSLSAIDVSKNTQLADLRLNENNLSAIDVSANTQLIYLYLYNNNLSEIDVSKNTQLIYLCLYNNNNLSEIDVSKNTELTSLELYGNNLSEIDVSANTQLKHLDLYHNNLSEIDVSKNTQLTYLDLRDNSLSAIDLRQNTHLEILLLDHNNLSEIDVSKNTQLTYLDLDSNNLSTIDVSTNTQLISLYLYNNNLLSLNITNQNTLGFSRVNFSHQTRTINPVKENNKYTINLKEYDSNLNPSKVELNQEGIEYDSKTGVISFTTIPQTIKYTYITDKEKNMDVTIITNEPPKITTFYIGGNNNPEYATSTTSSIYLTWNDDDVVEYCISKTGSRTSCDWQSTSDKVVNTSYTLDNGDGTKTLYAYIKDDAGLISEVASDSIILDTTKPVITTFYLGGNNNPEYATSTASSIYLTWNDDDVVEYCISKTSSSTSCDWQSTSDKEINKEYILDGELGSQTRYAYIKDRAGLISEVKEDSIILQTEKPLIKTFYIGGKENPKYATTIENKIYLRHEEEDIEAYCVTTTNDSSNCKWINIDKEEIEEGIKLESGDGTKTLYAFLRNKAGLISEVASDSIILDTTKPVIKEFYIGGKENPEKIESNVTSLYITWEDNDVIKYCINTEENSDTCDWGNTNGKEIVTNYTLTSGDGEKVLYAYIQDEAGYISNEKMDKITVKKPIPAEEIKTDDNNNNPSQNETDKPLDKGPQTGGYTIGVILIVGIVTGIYYKYYLSKKDKLKKI